MELVAFSDSTLILNTASNELFMRHGNKRMKVQALNDRVGIFVEDTILFLDRVNPAIDNQVPEIIRLSAIKSIPVTITYSFGKFRKLEVLFAGHRVVLSRLLLQQVPNWNWHVSSLSSPAELLAASSQRLYDQVFFADSKGNGLRFERMRKGGSRFSTFSTTIGGERLDNSEEYVEMAKNGKVKQKGQRAKVEFKVFSD